MSTLICLPAKLLAQSEAHVTIPGGKPGTCALCQQCVVIAPSGQQILAKGQASRVICLDCTPAIATPEPLTPAQEAELADRGIHISPELQQQIYTELLGKHGPAKGDA